MNIRLEQPEDYREVENLTREAFWNVYCPGCKEHFVLNQYRNNPDFIPELDFVMEEDGRIIGHVMFSKAEIVKMDGTPFPAWTFGPISIHPDYKRKGYGLKLLQYAIEKAKEMGIGVLCMEGNIDFYKHAGFVLASSLKIHYHGEPIESDVPYFLAQELIPGYLNGVEGTYLTPEGYFVCDEKPEEFAAYDATFPAKEKHLQEGQLPQFCQSCGMPMTDDDICGANADGSINFDYCKYCFKDGEFIDKVSMEEYIDMCSQFGAQAGMTNEQMKEHCRKIFPMLKRWRKNHANFLHMETQRLILRPWREDDAEVLYKYASDPEVGPRAGWPPHKNVEESREIIRTMFGGEGMWAVELKSTGEPIGCVGYLPSSASNLSIADDEAEVGYWIAKPYWNQGICTEAMKVVVDYCFEVKCFTRLWGDYFPENPSSGRVMAKCGFSDTGRETTCSNLEVGGDRPVRIMSLSQNEGKQI